MAARGDSLGRFLKPVGVDPLSMTWSTLPNPAGLVQSEKSMAPSQFPMPDDLRRRRALITIG
jgi:hypothetical protein